MRDDQFERLYEEHAQPLLAFLVYRTGDRALAEDILADTFERVLRSRWRFDQRKGSQKTWLYTIALNVLRDSQRRSKAADRAADKVMAGTRPELPPYEHDTLEQRDLIQRAMTVLSAEERDVVALRYGADLTLPEIARLTGEKDSTIEGRVYRALRKLRGELDPEADID
jgi:RNA polymerase sigma-70 factor (ECF subfamily)